MKRWIFVCLLAVLSTAVAAPALADTLGNTELLTEGSDNIIWDKENDLEFLWLDATIDYSYDDIEDNELGVGGDFEGWRIAKDFELDGLRDAAGIDEESGAFDADTATMRDWFCKDACLESDTHVYARGLIDVDKDAINKRGYHFAVGKTGKKSIARVSGYDNPASDNLRTYLVRDVAPVPEPGTLLLFGLGIAGAGLHQRRRRASA